MLRSKLLIYDICEENEHLDKYIDLVSKNKYTIKQKFKTQQHHIIPKIYFKRNNLEIDNSEENLVNLLYKDHILAHYYLYKCVKDPYKKSQGEAIAALLKCNYQYGEQFPNLEEFKEKHYQEVQLIYEELLKLRSEQQKGKPRSEETKRKISEGLKGIPKDSNHIKKLSEAKMGINNPNYGTHWDEERKKLFTEMWSGENSPIYGIKRSEETKKKISESRKGENHYNYGQKMPQETRQKISNKLVGVPKSEAHKGAMSKSKMGKPNLKARGKKRTLETRQKMSELKKGTSHTQEWKSNMGEKFKGEGNPSYNTKWYNNGMQQIRIKEEDIPFYENLGYTKGRLKNKSNG